MPPTHPFARRRSVSLADAAQQPFVGLTREDFADYSGYLATLFAPVKNKPLSHLTNMASKPGRSKCFRKQNGVSTVNAVNISYPSQQHTVRGSSCRSHFGRLRRILLSSVQIVSSRAPGPLVLIHSLVKVNIRGRGGSLTECPVPLRALKWAITWYSYGTPERG